MHKYLFLLILILVLSSCSAEIESSSANSISAIIAVLGEYFLGLISLILIFLIHCFRIGGIALLTVGLYMISSGNNMWNLNPNLLLSIGILIVITSLFIPANNYEPKVIIAKKIPKTSHYNNDKKKVKNSYIADIIIGVIVGIITMIIDRLIL